MHIEFTREGREDKGDFKASTGGSVAIQVHGRWETSIFEDEFESGHEITKDSTEDEIALVKWIVDCRETWLQLLRVPYAWTRLSFQEAGFMVEIKQDADTLINGWSMITGDCEIRWSADFLRIDDVAAAVVEIRAAIEWIQTEFAGREHDPFSEVEFAEQDDDPMIVDERSSVDLATYAKTVGTEFRSDTEAVRKAMKSYHHSKGVVDHLYWTTTELHRRGMIGNDAYDQISSDLYIRDENDLVLKDHTQRYQ